MKKTYTCSSGPMLPAPVLSISVALELSKGGMQRTATASRVNRSSRHGCDVDDLGFAYFCTWTDVKVYLGKTQDSEKEGRVQAVGCVLQGFIFALSTTKKTSNDATPSTRDANSATAQSPFLVLPLY